MAPIGMDAHLTINGEPDYSGGYDPGSPGGTPKYDGICDAQDSDSGFQFKTGSGTLESISADVRIYVPQGQSVKKIDVGDTGTLMRHGLNETITVEKVRLIDKQIFVNLI